MTCRPGLAEEPPWPLLLALYRSLGPSRLLAAPWTCPAAHLTCSQPTFTRWGGQHCRLLAPLNQSLSAIHSDDVAVAQTRNRMGPPSMMTRVISPGLQHFRSMSTDIQPSSLDPPGLCSEAAFVSTPGGGGGGGAASSRNLWQSPGSFPVLNWCSPVANFFTHLSRVISLREGLLKFLLLDWQAPIAGNPWVSAAH